MVFTASIHRVCSYVCVRSRAKLGCLRMIQYGGRNGIFKTSVSPDELMTFGVQEAKLLFRLGTGSTSQDKESWLRQKQGNWVRTGARSRQSRNHRRPSTGEAAPPEALPEGPAGGALPEVSSTRFAFTRAKTYPYLVHGTDIPV